MTKFTNFLQHEDEEKIALYCAKNDIEFNLANAYDVTMATFKNCPIIYKNYDKVTRTEEERDITQSVARFVECQIRVVERIAEKAVLHKEKLKTEKRDINIKKATLDTKPDLDKLVDNLYRLNIVDEHSYLALVCFLMQLKYSRDGEVPENDKTCVFFNGVARNGKSATAKAKGIIEGLSQTVADAIFYGNSKIDPDESDGLAVICSKIDGRRVINAGGTGDNLTSVYIVQWDKVEAKGIYPRGSATGGITHDDLGEDTVTDENGKIYQAYVDHFQCHMGLGITNPKRVARICNIPVDPKEGEKINLSKMIIRALNNMKQQGKGAVIYGNATAINLLDIEALNKATVQLEDAFGMPVTQFRPGNPIRLCEAILDSEEQVA